MQFAAFIPTLAQSYDESLLLYYFNQVATVEGIVGAVILLVVGSMVLMFDRLKWIGLTAILFLLTMAIDRGQYVPKLPSPFLQLAGVARLIAFALLLVLLVSAVRPSQVGRTLRISSPAILLLALQLTMCVRLLIGPFALKGVSAAPIYVLLFLIFGVGLAKWLADARAMRWMLRSIAWTPIVMTLASLAVFILNPGAAIAGDRLFGPTVNPQWLAAQASLSIPFALAMVTDRQESKRSRIFFAVAAALAVILVLGTGSRMGGLAVLVGFLAFFRNRLGTLALTGGVIAGLIFAIFASFGSDLAVGSGRMLDTTNTRTEVWNLLFDQFISSPALGVNRENGNENSYLAVAAGYGMLGLFPLSLMVFRMGSRALRVLRLRPRLPGIAPLVDLLIASTAQFLVIWMFEGLLVGVLTDHLIMLYCLFGVMSFVGDRVATMQMEDVDTVGRAGIAPAERSPENLIPAA